MRRTETLERLRHAELDLLVIGGGIVGSRIAFEAALRGLRVALVDSGDFGGGASSASSKLVHGGFRYLPMGDIGLVRQSQRERLLLMESIAPNLVRRLSLLLPVYRGASKGPATVTTGLLLYRALAGAGGRVGVLDSGAALKMVPQLRVGGLRMCGVFEETETIDSRLVLATVKAASLSGALVLNHAAVAGLELRRNRGGHVTIDAKGGGVLEVRARNVINASGPWVDHVRRLDDYAASPRIRSSKGVHLMLRLPQDWRGGVAMPLPGGRVSLGIPWQGMLMLGTTDTLYIGDPADVVVTAGDVSTVLAEAAGFLPAEMLTPDRVRFQFAGLRALPIADGNTAEARRGHLIDVSHNGLISVAGGKLTTHRLIAVDALKHVTDGRLDAMCPDTSKLPGTGWSLRVRSRRGLDPDIADHLERLYGDEAGAVLDAAANLDDGMARIHPDGPDIWGQVAYAFDAEWARTADDVARRRTTISVRGLLTSEIAARMSMLASNNSPQLVFAEALRS